jgi:hypothetical protein
MSRKTSTHPADTFRKKILNHYPNTIKMAQDVSCVYCKQHGVSFDENPKG